MTKLYLATFVSSKFDFQVVSDEPRKAMALLKKGLRKHGKAYNIGMNWWKEFEGDCYVQAFQQNIAYQYGLGNTTI
jgi:hypothetical protein